MSPVSLKPGPVGVTAKQVPAASVAVIAVNVSNLFMACIS